MKWRERVRSGEREWRRGSGISVLAARQDDDDDDEIYILSFTDTLFHCISTLSVARHVRCLKLGSKCG